MSDRYFEVAKSLDRISKEVENLYLSFMIFTDHLRNGISSQSFTLIQLTNHLKFYRDIYNILLLEYEYLSFGTISFNYQRVEANAANCIDDKTQSSSATICCCQWLQNFEKKIIIKDSSDRIDNVSNQITNTGTNLNRMKKNLRDDDCNSFLHNCGIKILFINEDRPLIQSIFCPTPEIRIISSWSKSIETFVKDKNRSKLFKQIPIRMGHNSLPINSESAFCIPSADDQLVPRGINEDIDNTKNHLDSVEDKLVSVENSLVTTETDSLLQQLNGLFSQITEYTEEIVLQAVKKEERLRELSFSIVMISRQMGLDFKRIITTMESKLKQSFKKLETTLSKKECRSLKSHCLSTHFEILEGMLIFCRALIERKETELQPYFNDSIEDVRNALLNADLSSYITREDELFVSLSNASIVSSNEANREVLFNKIIQHPYCFLDEDTTVYNLMQAKSPAYLYQRCSKRITDAANLYHSQNNPFIQKEPQPQLPGLADTFEKKLTITKTIEKKSKSPKQSYSGGAKLDKSGAAKVSKKRKKTRPDDELRETLKSFKKQKKERITVNIKSDSSEDEDEDDDEFDEDKDLGSENEDAIDEEDEGEEDRTHISSLPRLQEKLLRNYQSQTNMSPTVLIQSFLSAAVKLFGRDKIQDVLTTMPTDDENDVGNRELDFNEEIDNDDSLSAPSNTYNGVAGGRRQFQGDRATVSTNLDVNMEHPSRIPSGGAVDEEPTLEAPLPINSIAGDEPNENFDIPPVESIATSLTNSMLNDCMEIQQEDDVENTFGNELTKTLDNLSGTSSNVYIDVNMEHNATISEPSLHPPGRAVDEPTNNVDNPLLGDVIEESTADRATASTYLDINMIHNASSFNNIVEPSLNPSVSGDSNNICMEIQQEDFNNIVEPSLNPSGLDVDDSLTTNIVAPSLNPSVSGASNNICMEIQQEDFNNIVEPSLNPPVSGASSNICMEIQQEDFKADNNGGFLPMEVIGEEFFAKTTVNLSGSLSLETKTTKHSPIGTDITVHLPEININNEDEFDGYAAEDRPKFTKDGKHRTTAPIDVEIATKSIELDFMLELDKALEYPCAARSLLNSIVPNAANGIGNPWFKCFKVPLVPYADEIDIASHLTVRQNTKIKGPDPLLNSAVVCVLNMFLYAIRELLLFQPFVGSRVHLAYLQNIIREGTTKKPSTDASFDLEVSTMWQSLWFKEHLCPSNCVDRSFKEIVVKSFTKYYSFLNSHKTSATTLFLLNFIPDINLPAQCNFYGFFAAIQEKFKSKRHFSTDDNILFASFGSLPVETNFIPITIRLSFEGKGYIYQIASIFYRSSNSHDTLTTIISKSNNGKWYSFRWESKSNVLAKYTIPLEKQPFVLPKYHIKHGERDYYMEGIIFVRIWDQRCSFCADYLDTLESPIVSRLENALRSDVLADDLKSVNSLKGWLVESIISNMFVRLKAHFGCESILVEEVSQVLLDDNILRDLGKVTKQHRDIKITCPYTDLETWKDVFKRIDEHLGMSNNLTELFKPSRFLFIPINVRQSHWILMVVSTGQKRIFIMDSLLKDGQQSNDLYLGAIFIKYLEHKASISKGAFSMDQDWRVESLPVIDQNDHVSCGIHVIMNTAKLMYQIAVNRQVQLSFVEEPVPKFSKLPVKDINELHLKDLNDYVKKVRSSMYEMFLYRQSLEDVLKCIYSEITSQARAQSPVVKKGGKKTPNKEMKVKFLG